MLHKSDGEALPATDKSSHRKAPLPALALRDIKMLCVEIAASTDTEATSAFQGLDSAESQDRGQKISEQKGTRQER
jgi:hypothetical protein